MDNKFNKPMMASEIVAALSDPSRGVKGYIKGKYAKAMARSVQSDIASSQKFVLSNSSFLIRAYNLIMLIFKTIERFNFVDKK